MAFTGHLNRRAQDLLVLTAEQDDAAAKTELGQVAQEFDAVHAGHIEIADNEVELLLTAFDHG